MGFLTTQQKGKGMLQKHVLCSYPIKFLQDKLEDITTGDFIMIAANTGTGKSTISRIFMKNAIDNDCPVVLYSLEDQAETAAANDCYIEAIKDGCELTFKQFLKENTLDPKKYEKYRLIAAKNAMRTNSDGLKYCVVHENTSQGTWSLRGVLATIQKEIQKGYKLFIIDHIDVLVPSEKPEDMVQTIRELWRIVAENNVALITFSQLASRRNQESLCPSLDDLRGSKSKIHTPTVVISISRHLYGQYQSTYFPDASPTYMRVLKNRFGTTGCAMTFFYKGRYLSEYQILECNESGTYIDGKTASAMSKQKVN